MKTLTVARESEVSRLLHSAAGTDQPTQVDTGDALFEVRVLQIDRSRSATSIPVYDPDLVQQALDASFGTLSGVDIDQLLADLREQRGQDSKGRPA